MPSRRRYDKLNASNVGAVLLPDLYFTTITAGPDSLHRAIKAVERALRESAARLGELHRIEEAEEPAWAKARRGEETERHDIVHDSIVHDSNSEGASETGTDEHNSRRRKHTEMSFLKAISKKLSSLSLQSHLVVHRGFHSVTDRSSRPLENSLASFEAAWTNGLNLCECDVALTVDGHVVLCHDESFERLALFAAAEGATTKPVNEMTLRELMGLQLRTGSRKFRRGIERAGIRGGTRLEMATNLLLFFFALPFSLSLFRHPL